MRLTWLSSTCSDHDQLYDSGSISNHVQTLAAMVAAAAGSKVLQKNKADLGQKYAKP